MPTNAALPQAAGFRLQERSGFCSCDPMIEGCQGQSYRVDRCKEGIAGTDISFRFGIVEIVTGCRTSVQKRWQVTGIR